MMKEGALQIDDVSDLKYPCARCGKPITEGKYCTQCLEVLGNEIAKAKKQIIAKRREERKNREENEKQGMYIIKSLME